MPIAESLPVTALDYERAAQEYYLTLPLEHFMEAVPQATQREITLESFALLKTRRSDFQYFSELLVQYIHNGRLRRVVPDNMLVLGTEPARGQGSYPLPLQTAAPFMVLEWVSENSETKDYEDRFENYEHELKTPYCLHFHPQRQDLRVYRHDGTQYVRLEPDLRGRIAVPELELEIGLHGEWVRYWHRGELLEVPSELQARMDRLNEQLAEQQAKVASQSRKLARHEKKLAEQNEKLAEQSEKLAAKEEVIGDLQGQFGDLVSRLKGAIERRAIKAKRADILASLPATNDVAQLELWLDEL